VTCRAGAPDMARVLWCLAAVAAGLGKMMKNDEKCLARRRYRSYRLMRQD